MKSPYFNLIEVANASFKYFAENIIKIDYNFIVQVMDFLKEFIKTAEAQSKDNAGVITKPEMNNNY